jgi:uncharacterized SAM-binding protein YcdF (DUF218 family)
LSGRRLAAGRLSAPTACAGASVIALVAMLMIVARVGSWLVVEDPLRSAAAIVVLNGDTPHRVHEAISLYRQGWAREIWLTQVPDSDALADRIRRGEVVDEGTRFNLKVLRDADVPTTSVRVLSTPIRSTAQELRALTREIRSTGGGVLIVVTSAPHTRRVRFLLDRLGTTPSVVRHANASRWDLDRWWRHAETRKAVVHEMAGLAAAFIGERADRRTDPR